MRRSGSSRSRAAQLALPELPWKDCRVALGELAGGKSPVDVTQSRGEEEERDLWLLLEQMGLYERRHQRATAEGLAYLVAVEARNDAAQGKLILAEAVKRLAAARLLCSVLRGASGVGKRNVARLLRLHGWRGSDGSPRVYHFLHLMNEAGLVAYSKKLDRLRVVWNPDAEADKQAPVFVSPSTPYSNIRRLRSLLQGLSSDVIWIDKHFDRKGFDIISDGVASPRVTKVTVISGDANCNRQAKADYDRLRDELKGKGIHLDWRILSHDAARTLHDRWIMDPRNCWNVPPVNSVFKGQASEILRSSTRPDVARYMSTSASLAT